jgi:hypothetical protein
MKNILRINNEEQRAIFETMAENLREEELEALINWGGELYRSGIVNTLIFVGVTSLVGFGIGAAIGIVKSKKEADTN